MACTEKEYGIANQSFDLTQATKNRPRVVFCCTDSHSLWGFITYLTEKGLKQTSPGLFETCCSDCSTSTTYAGFNGHRRDVMKNLNILGLVTKVVITLCLSAVLFGFSSASLAMTSREEAQSSALGTLVYNYERRANRGLVRSASNLASRLPVDSHPQEVLDLVAAAANESGANDFESALLDMASDAERLGFGSSLSNLAGLLDGGSEPNPNPEPDPLPEIDLDAIAVELAKTLETELLLENPLLPPVVQIIGKDSVLQGGVVIGYEIYILVIDLGAATETTYTYSLDLYGNITDVNTSI